MTSVPPPTEADYDTLRAHYKNELDQGLERFLEPPMQSCPWCGSSELKRRFRARDHWQGKPGWFTLDRCRTCGHVFQNPRLNFEGLDFYYEDFYTGVGQHLTEAMFDGAAKHNHDRAEMVKRELAKTGDAPKRWLDIGAGYGHFSRHARDVLPNTTFDGLDMGVGVTIGAERGWLDHAHQGMFPDLADSLAGQYDVVSMHHYLEHTRDQRAELDAAARVLPKGGLLLIEVPDPEFRFAKLFGGWWLCLVQPQHQHLVPMANLVQALTERGFTPVATESGAAHIPVDATWAVGRMLGIDGPDPRAPWIPEGSRDARRKGRGRVVTKVVTKGTHAIDKVINQIALRTDNGNAYRVLARKD